MHGQQNVKFTGVVLSNEWKQIEVLDFGGQLSVFFELTAKLHSRRLSKHIGLKTSPMLKLKCENSHIINGPKENLGV